MEHNIILAGVGGQGILTIARAISNAALAKGLNVKQTEVHGMSQRGGAVYSHLRLSDREIFSEVIPAGKADLILAVEPLEALRYVPYMKETGSLVSNTHATVNIESYPPIEGLLNRLAQCRHHIALDMDKLARAAGSTLASNMVALGASAHFLEFTIRDLEDAVAKMFASKGEKVVEVNLRAFRFGRRAAEAFRLGLARGLPPAAIRQWIETLPAEHLASDEELDPHPQGFSPDQSSLTGAESHAIESILMEAYEEGRRTLYEHEVYALLEMIGAISPPKFTFVPKGSSIPEEMLAGFPGKQVVVKLVSRDVTHKSEAGGVRFVARTPESVRSAMEDLLTPRSESIDIAGVLLVELVEHPQSGFGGELFVGVRATREFGPVIAAGLGGVETEYLASKMRPGIAVAKAVVLDSDPEAFLTDFRKTAAYDMLSGSVRGHERVVSDAELLRCFRAFYSIARRFCVDRGEEGPDIGELEVNPFAFNDERLIPLDGRGTLHPAYPIDLPRDRAKIQALLAPKSLAFVGVSATSMNLGRTALTNTLRLGFESKKVRIVHPKAQEIDGITCVPSLAELPVPTDLIVASLPSASIPALLSEINATGKIKSVALISGGAGETESTSELGCQIDAEIRAGKEQPEGGAAVLGPNGMGIRSLRSRVDTFFIPEDRLAPDLGDRYDPVALISQSGAFVVSRLSTQSDLKPAYCVSFGNQADVSLSDLLWAMLEEGDAKVAGIYLEGFRNLDGLETLRAIRAWKAAGKDVVLYKAGRTERGRQAAAGHTTALAGDYEVTNGALKQAGAWVAQSFREFGQALKICKMLIGRKAGQRVFAVTNAGMEAVAMSDAAPVDSGGFYDLPKDGSIVLRSILEKHGLQDLAAIQIPLDLTPMAMEDVYDETVRWALSQSGVDAVLISCVPLAPGLKSIGAEVDDPGALPALVGQWKSISDKPIVFCVDAGPAFEPLIKSIEAFGVPVFPSADEAAALLFRWLERHT